MTLAELEAAGFVLARHCPGCGCAHGYRIHPKVAAAIRDEACDCPPDGTAGIRILTRADLAAIPTPTKGATA